MSGPYVFDDRTNLLENSYVKVENLNWESIKRAAYSLRAGPLQRPIAMTTFAINFYFAKSFSDSTPFKATNIAIHLLNGLLLFWFARLLFMRHTALYIARLRTSPHLISNPHWFALAVAALWVVHPIQLTSVLYVVQRMTSLSTTFTLLSLVFYLVGRTRSVTQGWNATVVLSWLIASFFVVLGLLSKEIAALTPLYIATIELILFPNASPWSHWSRLTKRTKIVLGCILACLAIVAIIFAIRHFIPGYVSRSFGMTERLLTESRVLFFYLSLIFIPRTNAFGLFHDDIAVSSSLLTPWTTIPSVIGVIALLALAIRLRNSYPLVALGILWFFTGHALESTFLPLEIAHEHRNYLPSFGPLLAVVSLVGNADSRVSIVKIAALLLSLFAIFTVVTFLRTSQWSDAFTLAKYEALHHPDSSASLNRYATTLLELGNYKKGIPLLRRAAEIDRRETAPLINLHLAATRSGQPIDPSDEEELTRRLKSFPITPTTGQAFKSVGECIFSDCEPLAPYLETWIEILRANNAEKAVDPSYLHMLLARTFVVRERWNEAIQAYRKSYELDPNYLHPLFELAGLYLQLGRIEYARVILEELRRANSRVVHRRDKEINDLAGRIREHAQQSPESARDHGFR